MDIDFPARFSSKRLSIALLISLFLSLSISAYLDKDSVGMVRRGDFPAFYAAAKIVQQRQGEDLYSRHLQQEIENTYWPTLDGNYFAFAYPSFYAVYVSPLAQYSPFAAKLIFMAAQFFFFSLAFLLLRSRESLVKNYPIEFLALLFSFAPLFVGLVAGQGAALNLLFLLIVMAGIERSSRWEKDVLLGLLLGLWLYKPQLSLIGLLFSSTVCRPLAIWSGWVLGAALVYSIGILASGSLWPGLWVTQASYFAKTDFAVNGFQMVSLVAVCGEAAIKFGLSREHGQYFGSALSLLFVIVALLFATRGEKAREKVALFLGPTLMLCAGHVLFYEVGLLLPALLHLLRRRSSPMFTMLIVNIFTFACCFLREHYAVQPLFFLGLAVFFLLFFKERNETLITRSV